MLTTQSLETLLAMYNKADIFIQYCISKLFSLLPSLSLS